MLVSGPSAPCSDLVPAGWLEGVESADFPGQGELATDPAQAWRLFGVRQTGQLDKANERTADSIGIVRKCEARDRQAAEAIEGRTWLEKLTPWREP